MCIYQVDTRVKRFDYYDEKSVRFGAASMLNTKAWLRFSRIKKPPIFGWLYFDDYLVVFRHNKTHSK